MSFKHIFIQNNSHLSYKNNSLHVRTDLKDTLVSLDDIDILVIENTRSTITSYLLSKLAQKDIVVIFVDEFYMPSAISLGLYKNSRVFKIQKAQLSLSKPKLNRIWKDIISLKIENQAYVLKATRDDEYLFSFVNKVQSGDKTNIESQAALYYFKTLFHKKFTRKDELDTRNITLNYGYSILRSSIARHIIAYGLNPSFGIWHSSELNSYNLADDFLEPFRPIVDRFVYENIKKEDEFTSKIKHQLISLLYVKVTSLDGNSIFVKEAIKNLVASYQSYCFDKRDTLELFFIKT